jgi:hypothetical protein
LRGAERGGAAGGFDRDLGDVGQLFRRDLVAADRAVGADRARDLQRAVVDVADDDLGRTGQPRSHHAHAADGAGARDQHRLAQHRAGAVDGVQADRQRLGAGDLAQRDVGLGDRRELGLAHHEALAEHALCMREHTRAAEEEHVAAQVAAALAAVVAAPAGVRRVDRDPSGPASRA